MPKVLVIQLEHPVLQDLPKDNPYHGKFIEIHWPKNDITVPLSLS